MKKPLPDTRQAMTHKFRVGQHKFYLNVGLYDDGRPGEVFITSDKEGSTLGGMLDTISLLISISLQHGVEMKTIVDKLSYQRFEPSGHSSDPQIGFANSIVDYIARWLGRTFCIDTDEAVRPLSDEIGNPS